MHKSKDIEEMLVKIRKFRDERDWMQFHDPKNMAISISIEAAELLQEFQWKSNAQVQAHVKENATRVKDEMADIALYLFELADNLGFDLLTIMQEKLEKNIAKYPIAKAKGNAKKYTEF